MRGISKPWPPSDVAPDGQAPHPLHDAERAFLAALLSAVDKASFARAAFDALNKRKLRSEMYREQRFICIYCECTVDERTPLPSVEHWRPLNAHPEDALQWENLYLSCASHDTCNAAKGGQALCWASGDPQLPFPTKMRYENFVGYTSGGQIYVRKNVNLDAITQANLMLALSDWTDGKQVRRAILNLNHPVLRAARAAALDSEREQLQRTYKYRKASKGEREQRAKAMLDKDRLPAFVSIRVAWLRERLGSGNER
jgi:uncharacterized protein (TIGR02646 family)